MEERATIAQMINESMQFSDSAIKLTPNDFEENEDLRQHIKLLLNSALGKFSQKNQYISSTFVKCAEDMEKVFEEKGKNIIGFNNDHEDICQVFFNEPWSCHSIDF